MNNEETDEFTAKVGIKQECIMSPLLFVIVIDESVKKAKSRMRKVNVGYLRMHKIKIPKLLRANDMVIVAEVKRIYSLI